MRLQKNTTEEIKLKKSPNMDSFFLSKKLERNEAAIKAVNNYISLYLFAPEASWDTHEYEVRSYGRWASNEILDRIIFNPLANPLSIIKYFVIEMTKFYNESINRETELIFSVAKETGEDLAILFV